MDVAFDAVHAAQGTLPLADDILLDALFLDPAAVTFLEQRAEMLLPITPGIFSAC